jgi:hypothetical protein
MSSRRPLIYTRYSSDLQSDTSNEDHVIAISKT